MYLICFYYTEDQWDIQSLADHDQLLASVCDGDAVHCG